MKADWEDDYEMREEYDFSNAIKNPFFQDFRDLHLVSLDKEVAQVFTDSKAVNEALRTLIKTMRAVVPDEMKKAS